MVYFLENPYDISLYCWERRDRIQQDLLLSVIALK